MNKDFRVYLDDTISAIERIESFISQMNFEQFAADE